MNPSAVHFALKIKRTIQQFGYDPYDSLGTAEAIYWRCVKL